MLTYPRLLNHIDINIDVKFLGGGIHLSVCIVCVLCVCVCVSMLTAELRVRLEPEHRKRKCCSQEEEVLFTGRGSAVHHRAGVSVLTDAKGRGF